MFWLSMEKKIFERKKWKLERQKIMGKEVKVRYEYISNGENQQKLDEIFDLIFSKIQESFVSTLEIETTVSDVQKTASESNYISN